ncbi:MAG TPA: P-loop NTPase [Candidatus Polarisedimenticolia bacterium]|nr:P-loop NTPase [Candidatus Polarisedimenticolia bacterium]
MSQKKKKALGRGMSDLVEGSFSSIVEPVPEGKAAPPVMQPRGAPAEPPVLQPRRIEIAAPATIPSPVATPPIVPFDVISISSGKGGTGKSVLTSNLGVLMGSTTRAAVLDADLGLANIHILYNLMPAYNVSHVIAGRKTLQEILLRGPRGVNVIPGGSGIPELASLTDTMFSSLIREISALDRLIDLLLIDTPSGIDKKSLIFLLASDQVLVVTTEDVTALTDAYAIIKTIWGHRPTAAVSLVVNQARTQADGMEAFHKVAHVARKFLGRELALAGVVPFDENVERSVAERVPVVISHPTSPAARAIIALAGRLGVFHGRSPRAGLPFAARFKGILSAQPGGA